MTKFEEELFNKVPCKFELTTEAEYKKTTLINHFKNWHSDDEYQELFDKYSNLNDNYEKEVIRSSKLESQLISREKQVIELREADKAQGKEIIQLKSQLQQQALPVVPECVAVQIERVKNSNGNFATLGLFDWNHEAKPDYTKWIHENVFDFMRACTIGYTVEKPQLFYLKHIDMSKADKECDWYLITDCVKLCHEWVGKNLKPKDDDFKFTQQEIDSMETGSYEQIEVVE